MEVLGDKPNEVLHTYFWKDEKGNQAKDSHTYVADTKFTDSWHTYAVDWRPGNLTWYVDGAEIRSITSENVPDKPMEMLINLAVGGRLLVILMTRHSSPYQMKIDYVRVYDRKHFK